MEPARTTWTDQRLDDLAKRMDEGFARVDRDIRDLSTCLDTRFDELSRRIDSLQRVMIQFGSGLTLAVLATLVSVLATRA